MKWVQFERDGVAAFGMLDGERITAAPGGWADVLAGRAPGEGDQFRLGEVTLLAPVARPGKIVAIGLNYMDHCRETNTEPPQRPLVFTKFTTAITGPGQPVRWSSALTREVDFEAELAVVIGRGRATCRSRTRWGPSWGIPPPTT